MENIKWVAGIILGVITIITTWVLAHRNAHRNIYDKLDRKADKDFVEKEMKKFSESINTRLEAYRHESDTVNELLLNSMEQQGKLIQSMDGKLNILIQKMK